MTPVSNATVGNWAVHKFGGSSLANAERYRLVAEVIQQQSGPKKAVVVSAMGGVTNRLIELVDLARARDNAYRRRLDALKEDEFALIEALLPSDRALALESRLKDDFRDIEDVLRAVWLLGTASETVVE